jgi:hypothetical protein
MNDEIDESNCDPKYECMKYLIYKMTSDVEERPNCESILDSQNDWALNALEFLKKSDSNLIDELKKINKMSKSNDQLLVIKLIQQKIDEEIGKICKFISNSLSKHN